MQFEVEIEDKSDTTTILKLKVPDDVVISDIDHFTIKVWIDGSYETYAELNEAARGRLVFEDKHIDGKSEYYTLSGMRPATIYRARMNIEFITNKLKRHGTYSEFGCRLREDGSLTPIRSDEFFVLTDQKKLLVKDPLQPMGGKISKNLPLSFSEKVVQNSTSQSALAQHHFEFSDSEDDSDQMYVYTNKRKKGIPEKLKQQSITSEVIAARQSRDWRDFVKTGPNKT